jgi:tetratricopeptide (TPR) repeat protein
MPGKNDRNAGARRYSEKDMRRIAEGLAEASRRVTDEDVQGGIALLEELARDYADNRAVLSLLAVLYNRAGRHDRACILARGILTDDPDEPDLYPILVASAHALNRPVTVFHALREFLQRWPDDQKAAIFRDLLNKLEPGAKSSAEAYGFAETEIDKALLAEEVADWYVRQQYDWALRSAERLLEHEVKAPGALNNVSLALWAAGRVPRALEVARKVQQMLPDSLNAAVNLIHYLVLLGREAEAREQGERIRDAPRTQDRDLETVMTGLAYLADSDGIKTLFDQAVAEGHRPSAFEYHLAGTAACRLGEEKAAQRYWHRAVNRDSTMEPSAANLEDRALPEHERNGPWFLGFQDWVPPVLQEDFRQLIRQGNSDGVVLEQVSDSILTTAPWLPDAVPVMLREGDATTRLFALIVAMASQHADALASASAFVTAREGADELRLQFARQLAMDSKLPPDAQVWVRGAYRPLAG